MKTFDTARANKAVRQGFGNFVGGISDSIARKINYANPVTFTKNLWNAAGQIPSTMKSLDAAYAENIRASAQKNKATQAKTSQTPKSKPVHTNSVAPVANNDVQYSLGNMSNQAQTDPNYVTFNNYPLPGVDTEKLKKTDSAPLPKGNANFQFDTGFKTPQELIGGDRNYVSHKGVQQYLKGSGYQSDNDPKQIEKRRQANEVQDRRMQALDMFGQFKAENPPGGAFATLSSSLPKKKLVKSRQLDNQQQQNQTNLAIENQKLADARAHRKTLSDQAMQNAQADQLQQMFDNQVTLEQLAIDRNKASGNTKYSPHYAKTFNLEDGTTTENFAGYFDPRTGKYTAINRSNAKSGVELMSPKELEQLKGLYKKNPNSEQVIKAIQHYGITEQQLQGLG